MGIFWVRAPFSGVVGQGLSGPDGSRHSSDQHSKDVNSENRICPVFVQFLSGNFSFSRRQTPEAWNFCVFTVFEFLSHLPRTSRASRGRKFQFFLLVFYGHKIFRACLKAPVLTGYVHGFFDPETLVSQFWGFWPQRIPSPSGPGDSCSRPGGSQTEVWLNLCFGIRIIFTKRQESRRRQTQNIFWGLKGYFYSLRWFLKSPRKIPFKTSTKI